MFYKVKNKSSIIQIYFAVKTRSEIKNIAKQVIRAECEAVGQLEKNIDDSFCEAVEMLISTHGRVIVAGIGKSANIATKIVSTLNSTGTPAVFLHAADAIHGDLGVVQPGDTVVCVSKSGNTPEIKVLVPLIKQFGNKLIAIVGNRASFLASEADIVLDATVSHEACPNNLAPTSSTTAQLVMGDALAVALIECRNFTASDFARFHPGGALGKQLYMRVVDLSVQNEKPRVDPDTPVRAVILEMTTKRLGCAVVTVDGKPVGIITDGDLRRMLNREEHVSHLKASDVMTTNPKQVEESEYAVNALHKMQQCSITQLVVVDSEGAYSGVVHLHDILREGII